MSLEQLLKDSETIEAYLTESARNFLKRLKPEYAEDSREIARAFGEAFTPSVFHQFQSGLPKVEQLLMGDGEINPQFGDKGQPKTGKEREEAQASALDALVTKYPNLDTNRVSWFDKDTFRRKIAILNVQEDTPALLEDVSSLVKNYQIKMRGSPRFVSATYDKIVEGNVAAVRRKPSYRSENFEEDRKVLSKLPPTERKKFEAFFAYYDKEKLPKRAVGQLETDDLDVLFFTYDLGSRERRERIYDYWENYVESDAWKNFVEVFSDGGPVDEMQQILTSLNKEVGDKDIDEFALELERFVGSIRKEDIPVFRVRASPLENNPKLVEFDLLADVFGYVDDINEEVQETITSEVQYDKEGKQTGVGGVFEQENLVEGDDQLDSGGIYEDGDDERSFASALDRMKTQREKQREMLGDIENLQKTVVDPLFQHLMLTNTEFTTTLSESQIPALRRKLMRVRRQVETTPELFDNRKLSQLSKKISQLEKEAASVETKEYYYLPITSEVQRVLLSLYSDDIIEDDQNTTGKIKDIKIEDMLLTKFLKELLKTLKKGRDTITEWGDSYVKETSRLTESGGTKGRRKLGEAFAGKPQQEPAYRDLFQESKEYIMEIDDHYETMLKAIESAIIVPFESEYMPFKEKNPFLSNYDVKVLRADISDAIMTPSMFITEKKMSGSLISRRQAESLVKWLRTLTEVGTKDKDELVSNTKNVYGRINDIFDGQYKDENKRFLGKLLYDIADRNDMVISEDKDGDRPKPNTIKFDSGEVDNIKLLADEFDALGGASGARYPIPALLNELVSQEQQYNKKKYERNQRNVITDRKYGLVPLLRKLQNKVIRKSEVETALLNAHDMIRKEMNKSVYHSYGDIDNFSHVENVNRIIHDTYKVDLTASEIKKIDEEFGALGEIAKDNGVSEDIVYIIKSNFR